MKCTLTEQNNFTMLGYYIEWMHLNAPSGMIYISYQKRSSIIANSFLHGMHADEGSSRALIIWYNKSVIGSFVCVHYMCRKSALSKSVDLAGKCGVLDELHTDCLSWKGWMDYFRLGQDALMMYAWLRHEADDDIAMYSEWTTYINDAWLLVSYSTIILYDGYQSHHVLGDSFLYPHFALARSKLGGSSPS